MNTITSTTPLGHSLNCCFDRACPDPECRRIYAAVAKYSDRVPDGVSNAIFDDLGFSAMHTAIQAVHDA